MAMYKKVVGKIGSGPLAVIVLATVVNVAKDIKIVVRDRIKEQKIMEVSRSSKDDEVKKLLDYLTGEESYRYAVEFEAVVPLPHINKEYEAFNIPNCCEIRVL
jgi:hypothetical protein